MSIDGKFVASLRPVWDQSEASLRPVLRPVWGQSEARLEASLRPVWDQSEDIDLRL